MPQRDVMSQLPTEPQHQAGIHSGDAPACKGQYIPFPAPADASLTFIDLFAGVGGFRLAMQSVGGRCVFTSEWNADAQRTYVANYGDQPHGDITLPETKAQIPERFDVLCAGFPCQAFSIAGLRKGFADTRGTLFFDIEEIVQRHRPKVIFLENVKNLVAHDGGKTFRIIHEVLSHKLGYVVYHQVLGSMTHAGIPQNRERIFIVAFDPTAVPNHSAFSFPEPIPLQLSVRDLLSAERQEDKYYYPSTHPYYPALSEGMKRMDTVYQWRRVYVRENKSNVCPTLTANMGQGGHNVPLILDPWGIRKLTPWECFALQGYPMNRFVLPEKMAASKLYMQAGNSVTVPLVQRIAQQIVRVL